MPSVEMRRSTRVFVPKAKDGEFVRVLRSGRRLWVETAENGGDWCTLIENKTKLKSTVPTSPRGQNGRPEAMSPADGDPMDIDDVKSFMEPSRTTMTRFPGNRMIINVYNRKRKHSNGNNPVDSSQNLNQRGDRKFGLYFVRRKKRKVKAFNEEMVVEHEERDDHGLISIVVDSSCTSCGIFPRFLSSVLGYLSRHTIGIDDLSMLLLSSSISPVFASSGIHFTMGRTFVQRTGISRIFGARQFIPLFTVDFAAVPFCFMHLHATMFFRSLRLSCLCSKVFHGEDEEDTGIDESVSCVNNHSDYSLRISLISDKDTSKGTKAARTTSGVGRQGSRNVLYRTGVVTRSRSKRRRRSLRNRKARNPLLLVLQKASESAVSNHLAVKKKTSPQAVCPNQVLRSSARKSLSSEISVPKSSSLTMNVDVGSQYCLANLLVIEIDRGYRVEGAEIVLDVSASNEWVLAVKKDGSTIYSLKALRELRCNITNRFTNGLIWVAESGWKLEFPDRKDWCVFKELYKVCWEKNAIPASPIVKIIPVPGVCEVINSWDSGSTPFKMPDSYIKTNSDELSKALSNRTVNYDMDSEDEEWLSEFNNRLGVADLVSDETFESMIDAFEKASYCRPEDCNDEKDAATLCRDLANSIVAVEVYRYWMKKRMQKRVPLNRVFQLNQPRGAQLITKPVLRKKRSLKRSQFHCGRGKDSGILQAIAAEQKAVDEKYSDISVEEAEASASRLMELAIAKRQTAQFLTENADLAVYRATMALRIADAAQNVESEQATAHFLE